VALLLFASGCGSSDTTTGAATSTGTKTVTQGSGDRSQPRKSGSSDRSGSATKSRQADSSPAGNGKRQSEQNQTSSRVPSKKEGAVKKKAPSGISQNGHQVGSSQAAEVKPQGGNHSGSRSPTPQAESGSGSSH